MTTKCPLLIRSIQFFVFAIFSSFGFLVTQAQELASGRAVSEIIAGDAYGRISNSQFPSNPVDYYLNLRKARELKRAGNCSEAVILYKQITSEYRDDGSVWFDYGNCLSELDRNKEAIGALHEAVILGTTFYGTNSSEELKEVFLKIGLLHLEEDEGEPAVEWIKRAVDANYWQLEFRDYFDEVADLLDAYSVDLPIGRQPAGDYTRTQKWLYDISYLKEVVNKYHYDLGMKTSAAAQEQMLVELISSIPELTDRQVLARLFKYLGMLGTGHDYFYGEVGLRSFPLKPYLFSDGLYIIDSQDEDLVGARIEKINNTKIDEVIEVISRFQTKDNNMQPLWTGMRYIMSPDLLEAFGIVDDSENVTLTITESDGNTREIKPQLVPYISSSPALLPLPNIEDPLYLSRIDRSIWLTELEGSNALYLQVNAMSESFPGEFSAISERVLEESKNSSTKHLILDVRHNSGGSGALADPIVRALTHFDANNDERNIYVLIGRKTFSAAQILIGGIEKYTDAIFVGEPPSTSPIFPGHIFQFRLPFNGTLGSVSTAIQQTTGEGDSRIWVAPDIPVPISSQQYFSGEDSALSVIMEVISREKED